MTKITGKISRKIFADPDTLSVLARKEQFSLAFDSITEFNCYKILRQYFPDERILKQYKVLVADSSEIFKKPLYWKIDFCMTDKQLQPILFIEVKGQWIKYNRAAKSEFLSKLRLLNATDFNFSKLVIVNDKPFTIGQFNVINFDSLINLIKEIA